MRPAAVDTTQDGRNETPDQHRVQALLSGRAPGWPQACGPLLGRPERRRPVPLPSCLPPPVPTHTTARHSRVQRAGAWDPCIAPPRERVIYCEFHASSCARRDAKQLNCPLRPLRSFPAPHNLPARRPRPQTAADPRGTCIIPKNCLYPQAMSAPGPSHGHEYM